MPYDYLTGSALQAPAATSGNPSALPGWANILLGAAGGALAGTGLGLQPEAGGGYLGIPGMDVAPQGSAGLFEPYRTTGNGHRAQNFVAMNPTTGRADWFGPLGKPLLFARDLQAVRRVRKLAGRARRAVGGR
jgi:hypothetical protein